MYGILKAGGKEYKLEYTIEASLYDECVDKLVDFMSKIYGAQNVEEMFKDLSDEQREEAMRATLKGGLSALTNVPSTALTFLYAGLMEHHGSGRNADGQVKSKEDAKDIIREYFADHAEDGNDNFYDILTICMGQMSDDNFFKRTGLEKMLTQEKEDTENKLPKIPQDHQKPSGKKS